MGRGVNVKHIDLRINYQKCLLRHSLTLFALFPVHHGVTFSGSVAVGMGEMPYPRALDDAAQVRILW